MIRTIFFCIISSGFKYDLYVFPHMHIQYVKYGFKRALYKVTKVSLVNNFLHFIKYTNKLTKL